MKVVITAGGKDLSSPVDQRFGRAQYLLLVDTETGEFEAHDNKLNMRSAQGAGIQTARNVAELGAEAVITGNVGPNAFKTLSSVNVRIFLVKSGTALEAVNRFKADELDEQTEANVEGHWV